MITQLVPCVILSLCIVSLYYDNICVTYRDIFYLIDIKFYNLCMSDKIDKIIEKKLKDSTNKELYNFLFTNDGSVGLYNNDVKDIYHSIFGAKDEGWQKFIKPLNFDKVFFNKKEINVLDICYGIGYNTKALLKKIITSSYNGRVFIDALEYNKELVLLSPFIKDGYFKTYPEISQVICKSFIDSIILNKNSLSRIFINKSNQKYFEPFYNSLIKKYKYWGYSYSILRHNKAFLHNLYYHCISQRMKTTPKQRILKDVTINPHFDDARVTIQKLDKQYDIIFLDAFTPSKLPTLWSIDFFKQLYKLSSYNSLLVTYSNSAAVRHALIDAGFYVGKIFDTSGRSSGTIASKNTLLIEHPLTDFDFGLINTTAGIYYKDENLNSTAKEIIDDYNKRRQNSNLESSSKFIKNFSKNKQENNDAISC